MCCAPTYSSTIFASTTNLGMARCCSCPASLLHSASRSSGKRQKQERGGVGCSQTQKTHQPTEDARLDSRTAVVALIGLEDHPPVACVIAVTLIVDCDQQSCRLGEPLRCPSSATQLYGVVSKTRDYLARWGQRGTQKNKGPTANCVTFPET